MGYGIRDLLDDIVNSGMFSKAAAALVGLAILVFLYGLARYITKTDEVEGREGAKSIMIWGIITIFVMVSVWGFVLLLQDITGTTGPNNVLPIPQLPTGS